MTLRPLILLVAYLLTSCATTSATARSRCDSACDQVSVVLDAYNKTHPTQKYPRTLKELKKFAASKNLPLMLQAFSKFDYSCSKGIYDISYTCKDTGLGGVMTGGQTITIY